MSKDKIVQARVTERVFINNILHLPGETASVNLTQLGVDKLGEGEIEIEDSEGRRRKIKRNLTPGLEPMDGDAAGADIQEAEIAAVAPHAPAPTMPQGIPPGTVQSGTGELLAPAGEGVEETAIKPVAPEAPAEEPKAKTAAKK
jgi:hypothetical protein